MCFISTGEVAFGNQRSSLLGTYLEDLFENGVVLVRSLSAKVMLLKFTILVAMEGRASLQRLFNRIVDIIFIDCTDAIAIDC